MMSDNQRRVYCRILFLCVCALPTALSAYWICHPQTAKNWETAIQAQLGVTTKIDYIETPWPNETILYNLEFSDPDLGTLFKTVEARIHFGETTVVTFPHRIQGLNIRGLSSFIESINQHLSRSPRLNHRWSVVFEKELIVEESLATVQGPAGDSLLPSQFAVTDLQVDLVPLVEGMRATMQFRLAESGARATDHARLRESGSLTAPLGDYVMCEILRTRKGGHVLELATHGVSVPVWLISEVAPVVPSSLGGQARFRGQVKLSPTPHESWIEVDGKFTGVDLEKSIPVPPAERYVEIDLIQCQFVNGMSTEWNADLWTANGVRKKIHQEFLFVPGRKIALTEAIAITMDYPSYRSARREPDRP